MKSCSYPPCMEDSELSEFRPKGGNLGLAIIGSVVGFPSGMITADASGLPIHRPGTYQSERQRYKQDDKLVL